MCINDYFGSFRFWLSNDHPVTSQWQYQYFFTLDIGTDFFERMPCSIIPSVTSLHALRTSHTNYHVSLVDITYIYEHGISVMQWFISVGMLCQSLIQSSSCLRLFDIWCHDKYLSSGILESCVMILDQYVAAP